jgi:transcription antitermination protein NusB
MQTLYELDASRHTATDSLTARADAGILPEEAADYARVLLDGVLGRLVEIDGMISALAPNWPINQLASVDRNVLRVAIFEIISGVDTPPKVAANEAVELAKAFGSESSPKFVNGVLGSVIAAQNIEV